MSADPLGRNCIRKSVRCKILSFPVLTLLIVTFTGILRLPSPHNLFSSAGLITHLKRSLSTVKVPSGAGVTLDPLKSIVLTHTTVSYTPLTLPTNSLV